MPDERCPSQPGFVAVALPPWALDWLLGQRRKGKLLPVVVLIALFLREEGVWRTGRNETAPRLWTSRLSKSYLAQRLGVDEKTIRNLCLELERLGGLSQDRVWRGFHFALNEQLTVPTGPGPPGQKNAKAPVPGAPPQGSSKSRPRRPTERPETLSRQRRDASVDTNATATAAAPIVAQNESNRQYTSGYSWREAA
jgi:hypothetical protein